ncbi:MAG: transposase [Planctomycetes bacterium]|nr:transposase [Planctomycetota bacterium]
MAQARKNVLTEDSLLTYHVISRCTRREWLLGGDHAHRRAWVVELMNELLDCFAIDILSYAIMSNHIHLVARQRPDILAGWSREKLAMSGLRGIPVRLDGKMLLLPATKTNARRYAENDQWMEQCAQRFSSLSWFMKLLKQRISRRANKEDGCTGHFWESRFQTIPLLDNGAVLGCMAYVDLNQWRAGIGHALGDAPYNSLRQRLLHAGMKRHKKSDSEAESVLGKRLVPLSRCRPCEAGVFPKSSLKLEQYLCFIEPKAQSQFELAEKICDDLGIDTEAWNERRLEPGAFQGIAVGKESSRKDFAIALEKKTLADKTRIWL